MTPKDPDLVYRERAALASAFARLALASGWKAGFNPGLGWPYPSEWGVLYVDLPTGEQVSWHIADRDVGLMEGLPTYAGKWDGKFTGRDSEWCKLIPMTPSTEG